MCFVKSETAEVAPVQRVGQSRSYIPELDGVLAIAALLVILYHSDGDGPFRGGFIGVDVFFVLSAFLITSILADEHCRTGTINLGRFYLRRTLRLMPALLLFLTAYVIVAPLVWPGYPHLRDALIAGAYLSNFAMVTAHLPPFISHSWSLAAEEQFYLLWPFALILLLRLNKPVLWLACAWASLTALRAATSDWTTYYYGLASHGTGLLAGSILFFLIRDRAITFRPFHAMLAGCILAILALEAQILASKAAITCAEFVAAIMIGTLAVSQGSMRLLAARPLVMLGKLSYGLYLWHYPIAFAIRDDLGFLATFVITLSLSLVCAVFSYVTVEAWAMQLRDRRKPLATNVAGPSV